jgi:intracellular septation protein
MLPVVAFTVIEEKYGTFWGILAGMAFSIGEMAWEWARLRAISTITWATGLLILLLGGISLWASEGIWFKLQPAIMEFAFFVLLVGSVLLRKPFLRAAMEKGGQKVPAVLLPFLPRLTVRVGVFFGLHAALAAWAAFFWSTSAWAWLKGVGFTGSFLLYLGLEIFFLRRRLS